ncbi:MAG TPA: glycosyltransferase [Allosphingosinicella sp.]|jgi:glycosyltransferase involved in cell wall biosynthesis
MLRILVLTSRYPDALRPNLGNFVERQTRELAARPGVEVEVIAPIGQAVIPRTLSAARTWDSLPTQEVWKDIAVHRPRFPQFRYFPSLRPAVVARRLLPLATALRGRFDFDVISAEFSWPDGPAAIAVGRALGVPVAIKARGMEFEHRAKRASTRRQLLESGLAARQLLAVSASVRDQMTAIGLPAERIAVHYSGVDSDLFRPGDRAAAKARLGISGPLLLAVGNLIPEKGHRLAVEALARLDGATLIIVGNGPERAALLARARRLGVADRLRLPGSLPHALLPGFFTAADVTVHPSFVEGFGNVRLESLACGTPLVTTAAGDSARIVDRPAAGRIVEPDPRAIAEAVRSLLAEPPSAQSVRAQVRDYRWPRQAAELERLLAAAAGLSG